MLEAEVEVVMNQAEDFSGMQPEQLKQTAKTTEELTSLQAGAPKKVDIPLRKLAGGVRNAYTGFRRMEAGFANLGIISEEHQKLLRKANTVLMVMFTAMMIRETWVGLTKARHTMEKIKAGALTAANANPFTWWKIVLAAAMAAIVSAGIYGAIAKTTGEGTGIHLNLPMFDTSNPYQRRVALKGAASGIKESTAGTSTQHR